MRPLLATVAIAVLELVALAGAQQRTEPTAPPATQPTSQPAARPPRDDAAAERLGWQLGVQAWTFRDRTAFEAIETARALGLRYIELYPGQPLAPQDRNAKVGPDLTKDQLAALKTKLAAEHVQASAFGVASLTSDEAEARKLFEFAKALGLRTITSEPTKNAFDVVEKLCREYGIQVAIHEHRKPNPYWQPENVLEVIAGRDPLIGFCADVGHWTRSGLDSVECLRKAKGRILSLHLKDVKNDKDVPFGQGDSKPRAMLEELRRQGFRGLLSLEYEEGQGKALEADVAACIAVFDGVARELDAAAGKR